MKAKKAVKAVQTVEAVKALKAVKTKWTAETMMLVVVGKTLILDARRDGMLALVNGLLVKA